MSTPSAAVVSIKLPGKKSSQQIYEANASNEFVFAVVGYVGSGTTSIASQLKDALEKATPPFEVVVLKASEEIKSWAAKAGKEVPERDLERVIKLQDLGDAMRVAGDNSAVARSLISRIRATRAQKMGVELVAGTPVQPDGKRRAYILDSLRHPAEVALLSRVYGAGFALVGVVCREDVRLARIQSKYDSAGKANAEKFMERDAKAPEKHGQRVLDTFHLSDYFIDNSVDRKLAAEWDVPEQLSRLVKILAHSEVVRPSARETAMYSAFAAQLRSACLSRQVGASLMSKSGEVVSVGANEAPRAGGGVYGTVVEDDDAEDHRCIRLGYCSNTRQQNKIVEQIRQTIEAAQGKSLEPAVLTQLLRDTPIGRLLEFSRAVHAEMEALLGAARSGAPTRATRMFVTTFPCHYCARHIISAGVDEVAFIEPYPKSQALALHGDAITMDPIGWKAPSEGGTKVLFRPFVGVAPRLYRQAFLKDRDLKDDQSGDLRIGIPEWGSPWYMGRASYVELEAQLSGEG